VNISTLSNVPPLAAPPVRLGPTPAQLLVMGIKLVPVVRGVKGPTRLGWNKRENCIENPVDAPLLDGRNVGIALGYCEPTPVASIDVDDFGYADLWLASQGIDLEGLLNAPDAVGVWSGKPNSRKLFFRLPPSSHPLASTKITALDGKCALEFRCATREGLTVQDLIPPSVHPDGYDYHWIGNGSMSAMPTLPEKLLSLWSQLLCRRLGATRRICEAISEPETPRRVATVKAALRRIDADCDYETWRNCVWALLSTGWPSAEDLAIEWSQSAPSRYSDDSFWTLVNSYIPGLPNPITLGSLFYYANSGSAS